MDEKREEFERALLNGLEAKKDFFDNNQLLKTQENYRLHKSCITNIIDVLEKKSLITPDPYKHDKKISDIVTPDCSDFPDNERSMILGTRLSDYDNMIDFICNYFHFSCANLNLETIKKLDSLNNTFQWSNLSINSIKPNTQALATVITSAKNGSDNLSASIINDNLAKTSKAITEITTDLRQLAAFQKQLYKGNIRKNILRNPRFNRDQYSSTSQTLHAEIKKAFPTMMPKKTPFYSDLVDEIIREDLSQSKEIIRQQLLDSLKIEVVKEKKKEIKIDPHEILVDAVRIIGTLFEQYSLILEKVKENHELLESEHNSFSERVAKFIRKIFNIKDPPVDYEVIITNTQTGSQKRERIHYNDFISDLDKRIKKYAGFATKNSPGWNKVNEYKDDQLLAVFAKQVEENNKLLLQLNALNDFFKEAVQESDKKYLKGIKLELTALKNNIVKANQRRSEYTSIIEEAEQMKKLGITNDVE